MRVLYCLAAVMLPIFAQQEETLALKQLRSGNLQFSANVYKELLKTSPGENFLVCPLSVSVILALVEAGAGGRTAQELITGLNLPDTEEKIHEAFKSISPSLTVEGEYTLTSANKIYLKEGFKIKPQFKDVATQIFKSEISEIDFSKKVPAAEEINKWVLEKTHDKIKNLISSDDLGEDTRAVLINALYFHGLWVHPFYVEGTTEKPFKISSVKETKTKIMEQTNYFQYLEDSDLKAKFLEMHYASSPISAVFILPNDIDGLSALESNIDKVLLQLPKLTSQKVHVQLPHVNVEHKIDFIPILQSLGIKDAFVAAANFSRLSEDEDKLSISKVIQKTFIAVEEKGTTAAAATAVFGVGSSGFFEEPKEFEANHPFIFILKSENGILFIGRYINPDK